MKILFIGAGNMGQAIIGGIIGKKVVSKDEIFIYEINPKISESVIKKYRVKSQEKLDSSISDFDIIILAVKPGVFLNFSTDNAMKKLGELTGKNQLVISIMAGITIDKLSGFFSAGHSIARIMPNTPALVGKAMSVISTSKNVTAEQLATIKNIFKSIGEIEILDEKHLDAVTALSGSGPAYVFSFIEALVSGGVYCGLPRDIAQKLALQTIIGSCKMITDKSTPEELRHKVTSPGGTTIEALSVLESKGFKSAIIEAVKAAADRSKKLNSESK